MHLVFHLYSSLTHSSWDVGLWLHHIKFLICSFNMLMSSQFSSDFEYSIIDAVLSKLFLLNL